MLASVAIVARDRCRRIFAVRLAKQDHKPFFTLSMFWMVRNNCRQILDAVTVEIEFNSLPDGKFLISEQAVNGFLVL